MKTIAERIKEALELRNMKQTDLVHKTGINKSSISTYLSGEYEPKQRNIYKIAKALNVSEAWLMGNDVPMERIEHVAIVNNDSEHLSDKDRKLLSDFRSLDTQGQSTVRYIMDNELRRCQIERELSNKITELENAPKPVPTRVWAYYGKIAAAGTFVEFADMIAGTKEYAVTDENRNADYTIGISGDSMEPIYYDGDIVFVKHSTNLTIGDIGIFQHDNGIYIKEYGDGELLSKNPKYKPMCYDEGFQCLGKVIAKADA